MMKKDLIDYGKLVDEAMHVIVFRVLKRVEQEGLPGEHHFFISFITKHKGVKLSENLLKKYSQEMTIVLQYQYKDLKVDAKGFSITLSFNGRPENIYIPYSCITSFADPSVQFGLQFREVEYDFDEGESGHSIIDIGEDNINVRGKSDNNTGIESNNVISFDQLRKKQP
jgi:hypothetical protein